MYFGDAFSRPHCRTPETEGSHNHSDLNVVILLNILYDVVNFALNICAAALCHRGKSLRKNVRRFLFAFARDLKVRFTQIFYLFHCANSLPAEACMYNTVYFTTGRPDVNKSFPEAAAFRSGGVH